MSSHDRMKKMEEIKEACYRFLLLQGKYSPYNTSIEEYKKFFKGYVSTTNTKEIFLAHYSDKEGFAISLRGIECAKKNGESISLSGGVLRKNVLTSSFSSGIQTYHCMTFETFANTSNLFLDIEKHRIYADSMQLTDSNETSDIELAKLFLNIKNILK